MANPAALLTHIVSQTRSNIDFLATQDLISRVDAQQFIAKLPSAGDPNVLALSQQTGNISIGGSDSWNPSSPTSVSQAIRRDAPPLPSRRQVRALWNWNDNGQNPADLSFRVGDVFELIAETNEDWWTGKHNGKQGLFPSNYVEKTSTTLPNPRPPPMQRDPNFQVSPQSYAPQYRTPMSPPSNQPQMGYQPPPNYQSGPPPQQLQYNQYGGPGNMAAPQAIPDQSQVPPKKSRFGGGMGNTLATAAVGGLGFGAGSAIGSDVINSLF